MITRLEVKIRLDIDGREDEKVYTKDIGVPLSELRSENVVTIDGLVFDEELDFLTEVGYHVIFDDIYYIQEHKPSELCDRQLGSMFESFLFGEEGYCGPLYYAFRADKDMVLYALKEKSLISETERHCFSKKPWFGGKAMQAKVTKMYEDTRQQALKKYGEFTADLIKSAPEREAKAIERYNEKCEEMKSLRWGLKELGK
jgi:hypothetical protein